MKEQTYANQLVFSTSGQVAAIGAEADTADVQIGSHIASGVVLKNTHLLTGLHVEDLGRAVASGGDILAVVAESDTAYDAFVGERVNQVDVEDSLDLRVKDGIPVVSSLLIMRRDGIHFEITQGIAHRRCARTTHATVIGCWVADLWRGVGRVGRRSVDLGGGRANGVWWAANTTSVRSRRSGALRRLTTDAVGSGLRVSRLVGTLRVGMRRAGQTRRLAHLMLLRTTHLLLLRRSVRLWRCKTLLIATSHDATEQAVARCYRRRLLRGTTMLGRTRHARLRTTLTGGFKLMSEHVDLFFVSAARTVVSMCPY